MNGNIPGSRHPITGDSARSVGTIDFRTGQIASNAGDFDSRQKEKKCECLIDRVFEFLFDDDYISHALLKLQVSPIFKVHGVLNALS